MILDFVNRIKEQQNWKPRPGRVGCWWCSGVGAWGKTRLLAHWLRSRGGMYSQALEGPMDMQIHQVFSDIRPQLSTQIVPKSWPEFLEVLTMQKKPWSLCIDEFPTSPPWSHRYRAWCRSGWITRCRAVASSILAGSSTRMMNDLFLNRSAPLWSCAQAAAC